MTTNNRVYRVVRQEHYFTMFEASLLLVIPARCFKGGAGGVGAPS